MPEDAKSYDLSAAIAEVIEKHPPIVINIGEGDPIKVNPVQLWPDEVLELVTAEKPIEAMRMMLGDDYSRFKKAGGTAVLLLQIFKDSGGADLGKLVGS